MKYLCLIYGGEAAMMKMTPDEAASMHVAYRDYTNDIRSSGHYLGGNALQPVATATVVRVREGRTLTSDGPFAETKEQLGGYYLVEARDLNEAIQLAARIPGAAYGSIEVRPVNEMLAA